MTTPEQPDTPQLTRRQLRELRNTASNPIITPEAAAEAAAPVVAPLPRAAEPAPVADEPPAAEDVDLAAPARTRRAARHQERLRTASVPIIDDDGDHADDGVIKGGHMPPADTDAPAELAVEDDDATAADDGAVEVVEAVIVEEDSADASLSGDAAAPDPSADVDTAFAAPEAVADAADGLADAQQEAPEVELPSLSEILAERDAEHAPAGPDEVAATDAEHATGDADLGDRPQVASVFGSSLLSGDAPSAPLPASFDQLLGRGSTATGSVSAPNALILSQTPEDAAFASPIAGTGEVLITGTYALPESFGSPGAAHGSTDGTDIDAILIDGELPAASSPTPISASAAISTIKGSEDIIKPPAPEKGSRLMLALVITAGALALALTGVLIVALVTGAFQ